MRSKVTDSIPCGDKSSSFSIRDSRPTSSSLTSEVLAAAAGANPEITLDVTDEMYRCSVVGPK